MGRARRAPRHAILDSPSVKTAAEGEERGLHQGKKVKGRSRHVASDSPGTLLAVHVGAANKAAGAEAAAGMVQACERHPSLESFPADTADQRQAEPVAGEVLGVELQITARPKKPKPSRGRIQKGGGFQPSRFRWRVERPFAWLGQCRLLSKADEKTLKSAEAALWCAMRRLLLRRLDV